MEGSVGSLNAAAYVQLLWRRKWVVLLVVVVTTGATYLLSSNQPEKFRSSTTVLVEATRALGVDTDVGEPLGSNVDLATELEFLRSDQVRQAVEDSLGYPPSVSLSADNAASTLTITGTSRIPPRAAESANSYAEQYVQSRVAQWTSAYENSLGLLQEELVALQEDLEVARFPLTAKRAEIDAAATPEDRERLSADLADLQAQFGQGIALMEEDERNMRAQIRELERAKELITQSGPKVTRSATVPHDPFTPVVERDVLLAVVMGLMLGIGLVVLLEYLDNTIKSAEDMQAHTGRSPILAFIPKEGATKDGRAITLSAPNSAAAEAYRSLRTSVEFARIDREVRVLMVTSAHAGDGKTTVACNLAVAYARAGTRVVLVSADLRRPTAHTLFGVSNEIGFTSLLLGEPMSEALQSVPGLPNLVVVASGPEPPDPAELLSSKRAAAVVDRFGKVADLIIIDTPPVLPVTDSLLVSGFADAIIFVASIRKSSRRGISRAWETLRPASPKIIGTVLNRASASQYAGYGYGYGYGSSNSDLARRKGRRGRRGASKPPPPIPVRRTEAPLDAEAHEVAPG